MWQRCQSAKVPGRRRSVSCGSQKQRRGKSRSCDVMQILHNTAGTSTHVVFDRIWCGGKHSPNGYLQVREKILWKKWSVFYMPVSWELRHCVTQLKLYTLDKLSSTVFCCPCECLWGIGDTLLNLHFFNIYRHKSPFLSHTQFTWSSCDSLLDAKFSSVRMVSS